MRRPVMVATIAAALFTIALLAAPVAGAWSWPVSGPVLQPFQFDPAHPYAAGQHRGVDIGGEAGSAIRAPASGSVTFAGVVPSSGSTLTIATADGYAVTLTHLGSLALAKGGTVTEGDVVGTVGPSGDVEVDRPYVHLGVRRAEVDQGYVDPLSLLPPRPGTGGAPPAPAVVAPVAAAASAAPVPPPTTQPAAQPAAAQPAAPATAQTPVQTPAQSAAPEPAPPEPAAPQSTPAQSAGAAAPAQAPAVTDVAPAARAATEAEAPSADLAVGARARVAASPAPTRAAAPTHVAEPHGAIPRSVARQARALTSTRSGAPRHAQPARQGDREAEAGDVRRPARAPAVRVRQRLTAPDATTTTTRGQRSLLPAAGAGLVAILAAAVLAVVARRKRVPIMERHALLRHDAHLLRQRPPAHRSLVHDHRGGRPHAPSQAARRGDVLPHRRRRARDEGVACR